MNRNISCPVAPCAGRKKSLLSTVFFLFAVVTNAFSVEFHHILPEDGLSQISVNGVYADEYGVIWMATRVGLNSYDGNSVHVFRHTASDNRSLFSNNILKVTGDGQGHLFLLCSEGIARLDLQTSRFTTLKHGSFGAICYAKELLVGHRNRVFAMSLGGNIRAVRAVLPPHESITCITVDAKRRMWIGTQAGGTYCFAGEKMTHPVRQGNITSVYEDARGVIWIGSWENGMWQIAPDGTVTNIKGSSALPSDFVRTFCEDGLGNMWIGTFHGLVQYNLSTQQSRVFTAENRPGGLSDASIWGLIKDKQGTIWAGTYFGGVSYFNPGYDIYSRYRFPVDEQSGQSGQVVGRMTEDNKGNLWICTEGGGLAFLNRSTGQFTHYGYPGKAISQNNLKAIYYDKERNALWIGTHLGGLDRLNLSTGQSVFYRNRPQDAASLPADIVRDIAPYGRHLVVATQQGVALMDPEKGTFRRILAKERLEAVPSVLVNGHELWVATEGKGCYLYDLKHGTYTHFRHKQGQNSLSSNYITNVMRDCLGRVWVSTASNGIDLYLGRKGGFANYGEANGLQGDCVYTVVSSSIRPTDLLLITNHGFSIFNTKTKVFRNYNQSNGFPLTTVNENALCVTRGGEVFIGGVDGMVSFKERDLYRKPLPYSIGFGNLYVNGKLVMPGDKTGLLDKSLRYTAAVTLPHEYSVLGIEYFTTNFIKANADLLQYRLVGSSDRWIPIRQGQKTLLFSGLSPGNYTLELRAEKSDIPIASLKIKALPVWYLSWPAKFLYALLALLGIYWLVRNYRNRIRLSESLKYEEQKIKDIEEQNQSKLRFFTNVSHEIRTPLTVITCLAESLTQKVMEHPDIRGKILAIHRNSTQLRLLITELLDFRKHEQGRMQVRVRHQSLTALAGETYRLFADYATDKDVKITFQPLQEVQAWIDARQMQKVINNLLSNAIKHTPQGGAITLTVKEEEGKAMLVVSDTGTGIDKADLEHIFDRFYQSHEIESLAELGTGIGLHLTAEIVKLHHGDIHAESEKGRGATFTVFLPQSEQAFAPEEIDRSGYKETAIALPEKRIPEAIEPAEKPREDAYGQHATILIVEDNDDVRQLLVDLFAPYYRAITATDGREGLEMARDEVPDIILSDVLMPHLSGTDLCRAVKQDFAICHIPVVLLTARTAESQAMEGLKVGADDYITKPFKGELLIQKCNNLINTRRLLQRKFGRHPHTEADQLATNPLDKNLLDRAMKIIDRYYKDPEFTVDTFAREVGMSRTSLFTKWKNLTGQPPKTFILSMRLRKAAEMLRAHPELSIADVSYRNGFSSARYFCKCFKDEYKVQPSAYRKAEG